MKFLVVDGNSILNRAFYGIRALSTKDGRATNGIFGFMNIFLSLTEKYEPDNVAIAFDLKAPTFRHKMYDGYKAGRHPAPPELSEQFAPLKELLTALGYTVVEKEGYEADDILGTLSRTCKENDECFLLTGDRDSFQLIKDNVKVIFPSTKMGQTTTAEYDIEKIKEEYCVENPLQLIDIKAIQGDNSDNIPGVAGIGPKGAIDLISRFGSVENIYENIDTIDVKDGIRNKLKDSKENAFLSKTLGTICLEAPIDTNPASYAVKEPEREKATALLTSLEMFKILKRLNFDTTAIASEEKVTDNILFYFENDYEALEKEITASGKMYFVCEIKDGGMDYIIFHTNKGVAICKNEDFMFLQFVGDLFKNEKIEKYTNDAKSLYNFCDINGIELTNLRMDTSLAGYLLNPNSSDYSVVTLSAVYTNKNIKSDYGECEEFFKENEENVKSGALIEALSNKLSSAITENSQDKLLYETEIPLSRVLASMEREGFCVDREGIEKYGDKLGGILAEKLSVIYSLSGCEFNVNSPKQLGEVLFGDEHLKIPHGKKTKSGYSTNADVLEPLRDEYPIINEVLEYRTLAKLKSTYCDGLLKEIDNDGRIHSTLNQTETRTGRISSAEPNLQNIPVRTDVGRELRRFFIAKEGYTLVDADYSQIELRVLASMANDKTMTDAFISGTDIHSVTASQVFNIPIENVTPLDRRKAKAVNFGIVYGIGAHSLSKDIGVSFKDADRYIKGYLANYGDVAKFLEKCKDGAKEKGYAETVFGRRRYLPELKSSNHMMRAFGERVAMNMPIQGTAADIIKLAMIRVFERLKKESPKSHLIMQVHDELIIETPAECADSVSAILKEEMENAVKMSVPFTVDVHSGKSWYDTK